MKNSATQNTLIFLMFCCIPASAWAIGGVSTSFFVKGFYHPMMVPAHLTALFSLGLLLGQQGWQTIRLILPAFVIALVSALIMTRYQTAGWNAELVLLPLAAMTGILVIFKFNLTVWIPLVIAMLVAVVIGMDSTVPRIPGLQSAKIYAHLTGSAVFVLGILTIIAGAAFALRTLLDGVILRILGAWSTAGAVLVVTLLFITQSIP